MFLYNPPADNQPVRQPPPNRLDVQRQHLQHQRRYYQAQQDHRVRIDRQHDRQPVRNLVVDIRRWFGRALVSVGNRLAPDASGALR